MSTAALDWVDLVSPLVERGERTHGWFIAEWSHGRGGPIGIGVHVQGRYVEASNAVRAATRTMHNRMSRLGQLGMVVPLCGVDHISWTIGRDRTAIEVLCAVLAHRPELRPRLGDGSRVERLVEDLRASSLPSVPRRMGARRVTTDALTAMRMLGYEHKLYGRPLPDEPLPDPDDIVAQVLQGLRSSPYTADLDMDQHQIRRVIEQHYLNVEPWPLRALTD